MKLLIKHESDLNKDDKWYLIETLQDPLERAQQLANSYGRRCKIIRSDNLPEVFEPQEWGKH